MTKQEISKLMAIVALEFSGRFDVTEERVSLWQEALSGFDYPTCLRAVMQSLRECGQFPPTVGTIYEKACEAVQANRRALEIEKSKQPLLPAPIDPVVLENGRKMLRDFLAGVKVKGIQ